MGVDFGLGDIITVVDPDVATIVDRITSVTTTYAGNGKEVTIGVGTRPLDLLVMERMKKKQVANIRK